MMMAGRAMKKGLEVLRPRLSAADEKPMGSVVIATVKGDLHDIGKNLVLMMLEGAGFQVVDLGIDVEAEAVLQSVAETEADIVALSALLTTTMPAMEETVSKVRDRGLKVKTLIGGAPVNQEFAVKIGADAYAEDAATAARVARRLLET
jgi:5-methyltetrahydrofolate--homocysteine methyltransferase